MSQIRFFSDEQEASIPQLQTKWQNIYLSTEPINRDLATAALKEVYAVMNISEPEIMFCPSPHRAIKQLATYISQSEIPQANISQSPEAIFQSQNFNLLQFLSQTIWANLKIDHKSKKCKTRKIHNLVQELSGKPNKLFVKHINSLLPKHLTTQQIIEQSFFGTLSLLSSLEKQLSVRGNLTILRDLQTESVEELQESFSQLGFVIKKYFSPIKQWFFRQGLKQFLHSAIASQIVGVKHPQFKEIFYTSFSLPERKFLAENPPVIMSDLAITCIWLDFAFSILNYPHKPKEWQALQNLVQNCGWIFAAGNVCLICDRPTKILLDEDRQLHGEGEPALEYSDGYKIYAYHGFSLPEKYGTIHPTQWQSQWVLEEENKQLHKALIQGIGAVRLCQELSLIELETKGEYTLFKLDKSTGTKATYILQRIITDTGEIRAVLLAWTSKTLTRAIQEAHENYSTKDFPLLN